MSDLPGLTTENVEMFGSPAIAVGYESDWLRDEPGQGRLGRGSTPTHPLVSGRSPRSTGSKGTGRSR
jgi:hypothetical protein